MISLPNPTKVLYTEHSSDNDMTTASFADFCATQDARNEIQLNVRKYTLMPVSYTHLTLPTIYSV